MTHAASLRWMRVGLYQPVHVKTLSSQKRRMLLTSRQLLQAKARDIENDLRDTLRNFGLKVGSVSAGQFATRFRELVEGDADLAAIVEPLLVVHVILREQIAKLLNDVNPQAWRADVLARIAGTSQSRLSELLPWNWKAQSARLAA